MAIDREKLLSSLDSELQTHTFKDYCPNGLQVEGALTINNVVSAVTASQYAIDQAVSLDADVLLVHHGYFWKGEPSPVVGMKYRRIRALIENDINLIAYHLPLDAHFSLGNNAQLGLRMGFNDLKYLNDNDISLGMYTELPEAMPSSELALRVERAVGRSIVHVDVARPVKRVAWCTGAGQRFIDEAASMGMDAFVSGEISEPTAHSARELGIHYFAAGHHATERYGVQALGSWLAAEFGVSHQFVDDDNPA